jgi:hypothetical protein
MKNHQEYGVVEFPRFAQDDRVPDCRQSTTSSDSLHSSGSAPLPDNLALLDAGMKHLSRRGIFSASLPLLETRVRLWFLHFVQDDRMVMQSS